MLQRMLFMAGKAAAEPYKLPLVPADFLSELFLVQFRQSLPPW